MAGLARRQRLPRDVRLGGCGAEAGRARIGVQEDDDIADLRDGAEGNRIGFAQRHVFTAAVCRGNSHRLFPRA